MKTAFKWFVGLSLLMLMLSLFGGVALWHGLASDPNVHITVNGDEWDVAEIGLSEGHHWLGGLIGILVGGAALLIVGLVVVPLVIVSVGLPLLIVAAVVGGLVLMLSGIGALLCSPLVLFGLVVWLLVRAARKPSAPKV